MALIHNEKKKKKKKRPTIIENNPKSIQIYGLSMSTRALNDGTCACVCAFVCNSHRVLHFLAILASFL